MWLSWLVLALVAGEAHGASAGEQAGHNATSLAQQLVRAKRECLSSSVDCLPALKQVRYRVWPSVKTLLSLKAGRRPLEATEFQPQVLKANVSCAGEALGQRQVIFRHTWKAAGWAIMANLREISTNYTEQRAMEDNYRWCEELQAGMDSHPSVFTFVREPLARFISGYAEIERTYHTPNFDFFRLAETGSQEQAKLFLDRFFLDGVMYNGHVKPQSEFLAPFSGSCGLRMNFIGKTENLSNDWLRFWRSVPGCDNAAALLGFREDLGQHPTDDQETSAMSEFLRVKLDDMGAATASTALNVNDHAYLRAFCWVSLADYFIFEYALPQPCRHDAMLKVMRMAQEQYQPEATS